MAGTEAKALKTIKRVLAIVLFTFLILGLASLAALPSDWLPSSP
jgi:hypothetical protein